MKKILSIFTACVFMISLVTYASAANASDWNNLGPGATTITQVGSTITVAGVGQYTKMGALYNKPVDLKNFSFEVSFDQWGASADQWFGLSLMNQKNLFDLGDPTKGEGLVILMRPQGDTACAVITHSLTKANGLQEKKTFNGIALPTTGSKFKIEFTKENDTYVCTINGTKLDDDFSYLSGLFTNDAAYFGLCGNDSQGSQMKYTLYTINGDPAAEVWEGLPCTGNTVTKDASKIVVAGAGQYPNAMGV